ncbi:GDP-mannose mannosyl hydrolase [Morganella morganii]|uniref:GDP-mannose mannosyl hydrolase n=1 Tax=Morganella morganii TaxID=582 RepID=UPI001BDAD49F|nr:GDP-mannose mannosyl hydrolase [Morganella morganii]MBT0386008.1 GDP-mannose mannosyl hydrolase [Morganella morganii subsp. morganii]
MGKLSDDQFISIIDSTPLISIDFIIENNENKFLLGYRNNEPAKNYWFIPGGRIFKNEKIDNAFTRLSISEFGKALNISSFSFHGVFEHFYQNSFFSKDISTHYIVLAYHAKIDLDLKLLPDDQHSLYRWFTSSEIIHSPEVNHYSKLYFTDD